MSRCVIACVFISMCTDAGVYLYECMDVRLCIPGVLPKQLMSCSDTVVRCLHDRQQLPRLFLVYLQWRVRQHLIEERSLLHRRFLQLQQTQKSLQQEAELRRRNRRESTGEAGRTGISTLDEEDGDGDKEEDTSRIPRGGSAPGGDNVTEEEEEETFETVEFLKVLRPTRERERKKERSSSSL